MNFTRATKKVRWEEAFGLKKPNDQKKGIESTSQNKKKGNGDSHKGVNSRVPMIRSLKEPGMNERGNHLSTKVDMRIIISYLTLRIGFLPLKGTMNTSGA